MNKHTLTHTYTHTRTHAHPHTLTLTHTRTSSSFFWDSFLAVIVLDIEHLLMTNPIESGWSGLWTDFWRFYARTAHLTLTRRAADIIKFWLGGWPSFDTHGYRLGMLNLWWHHYYVIQIVGWGQIKLFLLITKQHGYPNRCQQHQDFSNSLPTNYSPGPMLPLALKSLHESCCFNEKLS